MKRFAPVLLISSTLVWSWLGMMIVHELGHVIALWATGGSVDHVLLKPLAFSQTFPAENPQPLIVAWAGAIAGVCLPLFFLGLALVIKESMLYLFRFFAGVCLIANGAYLGIGAFDRVGDTATMLDLGSPRWALIAFGCICLPLGLLMWHRIAKHFGLGRSARKVNPKHAIASALLAIAIVVLELIF